MADLTVIGAGPVGSLLALTLARRGLEVEVYENPAALLFKGTHAGTLTASICGRCGYAELYVSNPAELLAAYRRGKGP